jgi:Lrp/AsnC family transcriptional regulator, leucine-responsive regulatory protein
MNHSRYTIRTADAIDRAILRALDENGRITARDLALKVGLSAPSATDRMRRLEDIGVICRYTVAVDWAALGKSVSAYLRMRPMPAQTQRLAAMLEQAPEIVEADRVTGDESFIAKASVASVQDLEALMDRLLPIAATSASIIQSATVPRRLPKF